MFLSAMVIIVWEIMALRTTCKQIALLLQLELIDKIFSH